MLPPQALSLEAECFVEQLDGDPHTLDVDGIAINDFHESILPRSSAAPPMVRSRLPGCLGFLSFKPTKKPGTNRRSYRASP